MLAQNVKAFGNGQENLVLSFDGLYETTTA